MSVVSPRAPAAAQAPVLRRLLRALLPYGGSLAAAVGCMVVLALTTAAYAWLVGPLLRYLTGGAEDGLAAVGALLPGVDLSGLDRERLLLLFPAVLLGLALLKGLAYFFQFHLMGMIAQAVIRDLRAALFRKLLTLSPKELAGRRVGDLLARFGADLGGIELSLTYAVSSYLRDSLQVVVLVVVCFLLDFRLSLIAFGLVPLAVLPLARLAKRLRRVAGQGQRSLGKLSSLVHEAAQGHRVIQAYGMEEQLARRFDEASAAWLATQRKGLASRGVAAPAMELLAVVGLAGALAFASRAVGQDALLPTELLSFLATVALIFQPAKSLGKVGTFFVQGQAGAERIFELLDEPVAIADAPGARELPPFAGEIRFEAVTVRYGERAVLTRLELTLRRGEVVAVVGESGAGKSTLAALLTRSLDPGEGRVTVDGLDLREARLASLRRQVALVTQETVLFDDTVRANVTYGLEIPEERLAAALRAASAWGFVEALPQGLETRIGERGVTLSGGQRQRLAIARALLRDAPILILDEATSALDGESEREVQAALSALLPGRTALVIAHRLSTIREATRICVLSEGRIVEEGSHDELLRRDGAYRRLHELQLGAA